MGKKKGKRGNIDLLVRVVLVHFERPVTIALFFNMVVSGCAFLFATCALVGEIVVQPSSSSWPGTLSGSPTVAFIWFPSTCLTLFQLLNDVFICKAFRVKTWWRSVILCDMWADVSVGFTVATIVTLIPGSVLAFPAIVRIWGDMTGLFVFFIVGLISRVISFHYLFLFSAKIHQVLFYQLHR